MEFVPGTITLNLEWSTIVWTLLELQSRQGWDGVGDMVSDAVVAMQNDMACLPPHQRNRDGWMALRLSHWNAGLLGVPTCYPDSTMVTPLIVDDGNMPLADEYRPVAKEERKEPCDSIDRVGS